MSTSVKEQLVTSSKTYRRKLVTSNKLTSLEIQERALALGEGLTSTEHPNDMTAWYCKVFKTIGQDRYEMCAKAARNGNKPKSLFGYLLKQEMSK